MTQRLPKKTTTDQEPRDFDAKVLRHVMAKASDKVRDIKSILDGKMEQVIYGTNRPKTK